MPRIVAESLVAIADPLRTGLVAGPGAGGADVARALARCLTPGEQDAAQPPWLLPGQLRSFRRTLYALQRYHCALLADPVGSGKTYVALAIASVLQRKRPLACLVPATLVDQWRIVAARLGVGIEVASHQQASRGRLPATTDGLVIVDESHHFRNPATRRYGHVAPWLLGRPVLLLSATPVVNRLDDLAHQLLLGVRDDALLADGVVSLRGTLIGGAGSAALGRLVIEDTASAGPRPVRTTAVSPADSREDGAAARALARIARLRLSRHPPIAALVRGVLLRAAASSPAALTGALRRYRGLLLHARDARRAGRTLGRRELRAFAGELGDQLVLWELLADGGGEAELALDDLDLLDAILTESAAAAAAEDPKLERLGALLADGRPTLVFATRRETVRHLRDRLGPPPVAWCTGERAGIGHAPAPRASVLGLFRDPRETIAGTIPPRCLIVTDVAAEGLDLRRAARVVHYDLPWTPMRLEQREGRAVRLGSAHARIEVVRFQPPPSLDAALRLEAGLARKAALPGRAGLGADGMRLWRWRSALSDRLGEGRSVEGTAVVRSSTQGVLAGFALLGRRGAAAEPLSAAVDWLGDDGLWRDDEAVVTERILEAARCGRGEPPAPEAVRAALDRLVTPVRARLALAGAQRWTVAEPDPAARRLAARLGQAIADAVRRRDQAALDRLERGLAFAAGGHTAGEARLIQRMAEANPRDLAGWLERIPVPARRWDTIEVRLTGLLLFER